jgi:putative Mg2+ transporter-C (MgtC) family protein
VIGTLLAGFTLWVLKWVDLAIRREHRAMLVVTSEATWTVVAELPRLIQPMNFRARFQHRKHDPASDTADYAFELSWRQAERAVPPLELLESFDQHFTIKSFELTTDNGR